MTRLGHRLTDAAPDGFEVLRRAGMDLDRDGAQHRIPDAVVIRAESSEEPYQTKPPLPAVEVVSPHSVLRDHRVKLREYAAFGIGSYWIATPDPEGPGLIGFELRDGAYREAAEAVGEEVVRAPVPGEPRPALAGRAGPVVVPHRRPGRGRGRLTAPPPRRAPARRPRTLARPRGAAMLGGAAEPVAPPRAVSGRARRSRGPELREAVISASEHQVGEVHEEALLWEPGVQEREHARVTAFMDWLSRTRGTAFLSYGELWVWSVTETDAFWDAVWEYFDVLGERGRGPVREGETMPEVRWFPGATVNYARNALRHADDRPDAVAVVARDESGARRAYTFAELRAEVARVAWGLRELGVERGDRVAAYLPNVPEALIAFLATASLGAVWSACSPDFGAASVIDRFSQIEPKVLIAVDGYAYNGKAYDRSEALAGIRAALPGLAATVAVGGGGPEGAVPWSALGGEGHPARPPYQEVPFEHPLWIVYSSGTTGLPKPIVHGQGGVLLEHLKVLAFHHDLGPDDLFFWYTTTGWMMWNYLAGGLLTGSAVLLYDGSATHPGTDALWRAAAEEGASYFGTGAPYLVACMKAGEQPGARYDLSRLRGVGSTGAPLPPEAFSWVYRAVKRDVLLGSASGGTDVVTAFIGPSPLLPVRAGVLATRCLGARIESYGPDGSPVGSGEVGELVITAPMPSMPIRFWNDSDGSRYRDAYFDQYPGVWRHGDWLKILADGGCVIYGRSDSTLNRGGVRMGTSEFYRVVDTFPEIADSLVIDTGRLGAEGELLLFVAMAEGRELDAELVARLRAQLRERLSPRHVPDDVRAVPGIPRTLSGKKLEIPVRKILQGVPVERAASRDSLANPEVLAHFVPDGG
ncbi:acetoacetyl-CoA synthetase [Allonocardiopsis opalescens]|uniref:Acetoacetyl-CoA synthetase n=1 Tax=Allonocardiopsis opalescens TaxID=1144618 RepID=A0A2T0QC96_9ACTN|nr:acetoacetyl-CoA synthetase [Allonocardiopsis opalescens]